MAKTEKTEIEQTQNIWELLKGKYVNLYLRVGKEKNVKIVGVDASLGWVLFNRGSDEYCFPLRDVKYIKVIKTKG
jgi:hypothetical protein